MENLKEEYEKNILIEKEITEKIEELEKDETVKKYFLLSEQKKQLLKKRDQLYRDIKFEEYSSCNHIWADYLGYELDGLDWITTFICIKCGLNNARNGLVFLNNSRLDEEIMDSYLNGKGKIFEKIHPAFIVNDKSLSIAKAEYLKLKEKYPDVNDDTLQEYLKDVLNKNDTESIQALNLSLK